MDAGENSVGRTGQNLVGSRHDDSENQVTLSESLLDLDHRTPLDSYHTDAAHVILASARDRASVGLGLTDFELQDDEFSVMRCFLRQQGAGVSSESSSGPGIRTGLFSGERRTVGYVAIKDEPFLKKLEEFKLFPRSIPWIDRFPAIGVIVHDNALWPLYAENEHVPITFRFYGLLNQWYSDDAEPDALYLGPFATQEEVDRLVSHFSFTVRGDEKVNVYECIDSGSLPLTMDLLALSGAVPVASSITPVSNVISPHHASLPMTRLSMLPEVTAQPVAPVADEAPMQLANTIPVTSISSSDAGASGTAVPVYDAPPRTVRSQAKKSHNAEAGPSTGGTIGRGLNFQQWGPDHSYGVAGGKKRRRTAEKPGKSVRTDTGADGAET